MIKYHISLFRNYYSCHVYFYFLGAEPSLEGPPKIGGIEETDHPNGGATAVKTSKK